MESRFVVSRFGVLSFRVSCFVVRSNKFGVSFRIGVSGFRGTVFRARGFRGPGFYFLDFGFDVPRFGVFEVRGFAVLGFQGSWFPYGVSRFGVS